VAAALEETGLPPQALTVEVKEEVLVEDAGQSVERLSALRDLGVRLAIDDFGTGYSSLEYLNQFPIDALKIAKPFVDRLGGGSGTSAIPRAITDLAEIFGLVVVAEGIERSDQPRLLTELGCRFGQGNHLAPALDREGADAVLFGSGLLARPPGDAGVEDASSVEAEAADS
jgi:EAL domain-containing protein (putative c-di-GMP-specific phosphodiesterase class I)